MGAGTDGSYRGGTEVPVVDTRKPFFGTPVVDFFGRSVIQISYVTPEKPINVWISGVWYLRVPENVFSRQSIERTAESLVGQVVVEVLLTTDFVALPKTRLHGVSAGLAHLKHANYFRPTSGAPPYSYQEVLHDIPARRLTVIPESAIVVAGVAEQLLLHRVTKTHPLILNLNFRKLFYCCLSIRSASSRFTWFILQMVIAGNGISLKVASVGLNATRTGFSFHFSKILVM
jgi:hypothetical protein